jgi:mannose-6-phosphate isomerase
VLSLVDHESGPAVVLDGEGDGPLRTYRTPEPEFRLHTVRAGAVLAGDGPQLLLCTKGSVVVSRGGEEVVLRGGESAFLPHSAGAAEVSGDGEAFWATTNLSGTGTSATAHRPAPDRGSGDPLPSGS